MQENAQAKANIGRIRRAFTRKEHAQMLPSLLALLYVCIESQMKFVEIGFLITCCSSFDIIVWFVYLFSFVFFFFIFDLFNVR